jgi:hypothetical protein
MKNYRTYTVTAGSDRSYFKNLKQARKHALSFLGQGVKLTNEKGILLPL